MNNILCQRYLKELETEINSSRRCLERIPEKLFTWKPHEKSMNMGYLALLVAEIPRWITFIIEKSEIDFATFSHNEPKTTSELVKQFDDNIIGAKKALQNITDDELSKMFYLKRSGTTLFSSPKLDNIESSINHLVHHRGQLTVYMKLNNIPIPSIYGPSADERTF